MSDTSRPTADPAAAAAARTAALAAAAGRADSSSAPGVRRSATPAPITEAEMMSRVLGQLGVESVEEAKAAMAAQRAAAAAGLGGAMERAVAAGLNPVPAPSSTMSVSSAATSSAVLDPQKTREIEIAAAEAAAAAARLHRLQAEHSAAPSAAGGAGFKSEPNQLSQYLLSHGAADAVKKAQLNLLDISRALKAPALGSIVEYRIWRQLFLNHLGAVGARDILLHGSRFYSFAGIPTNGVYADISNEAASIKSGAEDQSQDDGFERALDWERLKFAHQALLYATKGIPALSSVLVLVPSPNAPGAWAELERFIAPQSNVERQAKSRALQRLMQGTDESLQSYFTRANTMMHEVRELGEPVTESNVVNTWVSGLRDVVAYRRDLLRDQPTLNAVYLRARQYEETDSYDGKPRRGIGVHGEQITSFAHSAQVGRGGRGRGGGAGGRSQRDAKIHCFNCGKQGHRKVNCPEGTRSSSAATITCTWCQKQGHVEAECRGKANGHPRAQPSANANEAEDDEYYTSSAYSTEVTELYSNNDHIQVGGESLAGAAVKVKAQPHSAQTTVGPAVPLAAAASVTREAIVDSGANYHMVGAGTVMQDAEKAANLAIRTAGSQVLRNPQRGTAELKARDGNTILLTGAIQHDALNRDLMSVSKTFENPTAWRWIFEREGAWLVDNDGQLMLEAKADGGLYKLQLDGNAADVVKTASELLTIRPTNQVLKVQRIHERLGHPGQSMMLRMAQANIGGLGGLKASDLKLNCSKCIEGKMARLPYNSKIDPAHKAKAPLDRVHADLHGPVSPPSLGGKTYALVIIDEYSSRIWVTLLSQKSEAAAAIKNWAVQMHNKIGRWPKEFHTDRGTEFVNSVLAKFWAEKGVEAKTALPYTPQHNGMVERANRTLVDKARTMLVAAGAPRSLWGDALHAATYLHNTVDVSSGQTQPPEQLFYGRSKPPTSDGIRVWGCDAWLHTGDAVSSAAGKYGARAVKGVFVGYEDLGYRILDPKSLRVTATRHVRFDEGSFTAAAETRAQLQGTDDAEDEDDETYYGRLTLDNEIKLMTMISLEGNDPAEKDDDEIEQDQREPAASREGGMELTQPDSPRGASSPPSILRSPNLAAMRREQEKAKKQRQQQVDPVRKTARATAGRAPSRYGMVAPSDMGQGTAAELLVALEEIFTADAYAGVALKRPRNSVVQQEIDRLQAIKLCDTDPPLQPDRAPCNRNGELVTPSQQCTAPNAKGEQCKAKTRNGQYCWSHLRKLQKLRIKNSAVAGRGLFADPKSEGFVKGEFISSGYHGDKSHDRHVNHQGSKYVFGATNDITIDAARRNTAPTRLINDPRGSGLEANCEWVVNPRTKAVRIRATRDIEPGEELLISYSDEYWDREDELAQVKAERAEAARVRKARGRKAINASSAEVITVDAQLATGEPADAQSQPDAEQLKFADHAPRNYAEARRSPEWPHWHKAILAEEKSLHDKGVFTVVDRLPKGFDTLDCKWVFAYKRDADGKVVRYKARLVARGFKQREGVDYGPVYAPVVDGDSLRALFGVVAVNDLECKIMDVETAFLNAPLNEEIYVQVPPGFEGAEQGKFLRLNRALYGLKQAGREWNHTLAQALRECGYTAATHADRCVFTKRAHSGRLLYICTYVDDMPYAYDKRDEAEMEADKQALMARFSIKDLGDISNVLGWRVSRDRAAGTLTIDLAPYLERMLKDFGYGECRPELTPESTGTLSDRRAEHSGGGPANEGGGVAPSANDPMRGITAENYAQAVGSALYAANACRPDLAHAVGMCARATSKPDHGALLMLRRVFRYIAGTLELGLTYSAKTSNPLTLTAYSDADWGGCIDTGRSTTGTAIFLAGAVVSWTSRRQSIVALSSAEAEYVAASDSSRQIVWLRRLLEALGYRQDEPTPLHIDNSTAIHMTDDERGDGRRKHINIRYHFIRDMIETKEICAKWIATDQQLADIYTKPLQRPKFIELRDRNMGAEP